MEPDMSQKAQKLRLRRGGHCKIQQQASILRRRCRQTSRHVRLPVPTEEGKIIHKQNWTDHTIRRCIDRGGSHCINNKAEDLRNIFNSAFRRREDYCTSIPHRCCSWRSVENIEVMLEFVLNTILYQVSVSREPTTQVLQRITKNHHKYCKLNLVMATAFHSV